MSVSKIKKVGHKYVLQMELELDSKSMLSSEEQIQLAVNDMGSMATKIALEQFDTRGEPILHRGQKLSSKGKKKKLPNAVWPSIN